MCNRVSFAVSRSIQTLLNRNFSKCLHIRRSTSILACKYNYIPVYCQSYVMNYEQTSIKFSKIMGQPYSTAESTQIDIPIVSYEEVKDLPNHPEKTLIDVREPHELQETGIIPTAINIPLGEVNTALSMSDRQFKTKYNRNKPDLSDEIIFHCKIGMRSENAAIAAKKLGYKDVKNYKGSWLDWAEREGLPK